MLITHNKLNYRKKPQINRDNVLTIMFHNRSIHSKLYTNEATRDLLTINLVCYALVRRRINISVKSS